jgi:hypothetical protein
MEQAIRLLLCAVGVVALLSHSSSAANTPCSGRKGGISHCQGSTFICNDGSISASRKNCALVMGGAIGLMGGGLSEMTPAADSGECSCRSGRYCIGPRGGRYCLTDSGKKSYLRK